VRAGGCDLRWGRAVSASHRAPEVKPLGWPSWLMDAAFLLPRCPAVTMAQRGTDSGTQGRHTTLAQGWSEVWLLVGVEAHN
jgi:hypothetical protein